MESAAAREEGEAPERRRRTTAETTAAKLDGYLSVGHTLMPDFSLSTVERNALVTYILSLREKP